MICCPYNLELLLFDWIWRRFFRVQAWPFCQFQQVNHHHHRVLFALWRHHKIEDDLCSDESSIEVDTDSINQVNGSCRSWSVGDRGLIRDLMEHMNSKRLCFWKNLNSVFDRWKSLPIKAILRFNLAQVRMESGEKMKYCSHLTSTSIMSLSPRVFIIFKRMLKGPWNGSWQRLDWLKKSSGYF